MINFEFKIFLDEEICVGLSSFFVDFILTVFQISSVSRWIYGI